MIAEALFHGSLQSIVFESMLLAPSRWKKFVLVYLPPPPDTMDFFKRVMEEM